MLTTGSQRMDAALLAAAPRLKICANMAVGYNNFDVDAMTAAGVQGTNTPDVLTETTADFGFALLMANGPLDRAAALPARREVDKWSYDMFAGSDIHGSTLGIIGMGRIGGHCQARRARFWHEGDLPQPLRASRPRWRPNARPPIWARKNCCARQTT